MAGENLAIWEVQASAANGLEATAGATHTQLFNSTGKVISDGAFVSNIHVSLRKANPENEAVDDDTNEIQDMGITGLDIVIEGISGNTDNDAASNLVNKFIKWIKDGNTTTGYTKGRFGLDMDNAPQWTIIPTSTLGCHIVGDTTFDYIGENKDTVKFVIHLAVGNDIQNAI